MNDGINAHAFAFKSIDGAPLPLEEFAGKAVLVVNTASECGFTSQYAGLQRLWERERDRGLVVLGVPSNDFGAQEPGDEGAIAAFCTGQFGVDFPMTEKVRVIGGDAHPFYRWIAETVGEDARRVTHRGVGAGPLQDTGHPRPGGTSTSISSTATATSRPCGRPRWNRSPATSAKPSTPRWPEGGGLQPRR